MAIFILAYLAGVFTIVSPCILPVLPFVLARAGRPFPRDGLPMMAGMALGFAAVASLAAVAGNWAIELNRHGRTLALALIAVFGLALLFPPLALRLMNPFVTLGTRFSHSADQREARNGASVVTSALLGTATGLLWAPCAGPVLGLILAGAALAGPSVETSLLLLAYAAGAATSLGLALAFGGRLFAMMKRSLGLSDGVRRLAGAFVLVGVGAISLGADTGFLAKISSVGTQAIEQGLINLVAPATLSGAIAMTASSISPAAQPSAADSLFGAKQWLGSPTPTTNSVKGKVVLVNFWTYSCINCLRTLPHIRAWAEKYRDRGLVVIGIHTPEFAFEKNLSNVRKAASALGVTYPVAVDNDYAIWRSFNNQSWPARYFIDAKGLMRHHEFGEGDLAQSEHVIQQLLTEAGNPVGSGPTPVVAMGVQGSADFSSLSSPETYLGHARSSGFASPGGVKADVSAIYGVAAGSRLNQWSLFGLWTVTGEYAALDQTGGRILHRFHARDLHLVLGSAPDSKPIRFRIMIDGEVPGASHGSDVDAEGFGVVTDERLYQLIRQPGQISDRSFEIEFLDTGVRAYAFTFG